MTQNLMLHIKNLVTSILVIFLSWIFCGDSFALTVSKKKEVFLDQDFWSAIGPLSAGRHVKIYKNQSFTIKELNVDFFAGSITGGPLPVKLDCFVYVKSKNGEGKAFFASAKADRLWTCIGLPALNARKVKGIDGNLLIFSIFTYQAPSGEFFNFPLIIQSTQNGSFELGRVDECITDKAQSAELKKMVQLYKFAEECVVTGKR